MRVLVEKWGNSAAIRIPAAVRASVALQVEQEVDMRVDEGKIIIDALRRLYDLDELLENMDPATFLQMSDFGLPVGNEIW